MLMIFPIANADGKILSGADEDPLSRVKREEMYQVKGFNNELDNDTIKEKNDSLSVENEIKEAVEKAADVSSGVVSWYGGKFHGRKTASGDKYDKNDVTKFRC